jgi:hypothetical protein
VSKPARPGYPTLVPALVLANLLGSVGGGRVLSASKGLTGLTLLGSGSLMALLTGSVCSVLVLRLAAKARSGGWALVSVSCLSIAASAGLLWVYHHARGTAGPMGQTAAGAQLHGAVSWLFFVLLVLRCAFWFAARSLRTGLVSAAANAAMSLSEAAYFGGLVVGLLIGSPSWLSGNVVYSALALDLGLLVVVVTCDRLSLGSLHAAASGTSGTAASDAFTRSPVPAAAPKRDRASSGFVRLTAAYATATIGCQIVVFQLADWLARSPEPSLRVRADPALAAFYFGVAVTAVLAFRWKPTFAGDARRQLGIRLALGKAAGPEVADGGFVLPVNLVALVAGLLVTAGVMLLRSTVPGGDPAASWALAAVALVSIVAGSGVFEVLILAMLRQLAAGGAAEVALAIAVAGSAATLAMLAMLIIGPRLGAWIMVNAGGLAAAVWLIRGAAPVPDQGPLASPVQ